MTLYAMLKAIIGKGEPWNERMQCYYCSGQLDHHEWCVWATAEEYINKTETTD